MRPARVNGFDGECLFSAAFWLIAAVMVLLAARAGWAQEGAPSVAITQISPDPASRGLVAITVEAVADPATELDGPPTVTVTPNGGEPQAAVLDTEDPPLTFHYTFEVLAETPNGTALVEATATDLLAQSSSTTEVFLIDTETPQVAITAITQDGNDVMLSGESPPNAIRGELDIVVIAADGGAGLDRQPAVTLTDALGASAEATFVDEAPAGTFNYSYELTGTTANGTATVAAIATDLAGNQSATIEEQTIVNVNQVQIQMQLEGLAFDRTRTVTFWISDCTGAGSAIEISKSISFQSGGIDGFGEVALTGADGIRADLVEMDVSAKEDHTLRRMIPQVSVDPQTHTAVADLTLRTNHMIRAGDFNRDNFVDVLDFSILATNFNRPNTQADVDGNGLADGADYSAIVVNFFVSGDHRSTCHLTQPLTASHRPRASISVRSLSPEASWAADLTGDGVVDLRDVRAFARVNHLVKDNHFINRDQNR